MLKVIDVENWNRKRTYNYYQFHANSLTVSCSAKVDVTRLYEAAGRERIPFWIEFMYAWQSLVNRMEQFRYRVILDEVICYDEIKMTTMVLDRNHNFYYITLPFAPDIHTFWDNYRKIRKETRIMTDAQRCENSSSPPNTFIMNILPQLDLLNFNSIGDYGERKMGISLFYVGKPVNENGRLKVGITVAFSHALLDGYDWQEICLAIENTDW